MCKLVAAKTNGATPLVLSCRNGHQEVVEYLVDRCLASVEQPGSVTFDGETIEGAPPLWCAAAAGKASEIDFIRNIWYHHLPKIAGTIAYLFLYGCLKSKWSVDTWLTFHSQPLQCIVRFWDQTLEVFLPHSLEEVL